MSGEAEIRSYGTPTTEDLDEIEMLVSRVEMLDKQMQHKSEQLAFVAEVIAEKKRQCDQLREQHAERIRAITRQARRQRGRKSGQWKPGSQVAEIGIDQPVDSLQPPFQPQSGQDQTMSFEQRFSRTEELLDVAALDRALGADRWRSLLRHGKGDPADVSQPPMPADLVLNLEGLRDTLQTHIDGVMRLREKIAQHAYNVKTTATASSLTSGRSVSPGPSKLWVDRYRDQENEELKKQRMELAAEAYALLPLAHSGPFRQNLQGTHHSSPL